MEKTEEAPDKLGGFVLLRRERKENGVGLRDERVEAFRNGEASDESLGVEDLVEDEDEKRIGKLVEVVLAMI